MVTCSVLLCATGNKVSPPYIKLKVIYGGGKHVKFVAIFNFRHSFPLSVIKVLKVTQKRKMRKNETERERGGVSNLHQEVIM